MFGLIVTILSVASTIVLAGVVLSNNRRSALHLLLFIFSIGFAGAIGSNYLTSFYHDPSRIVIWIRWTMFFASVLTPTWYLFLRNFPQRSLVARWPVIGTATFVVVSSMVLALSPWMFKSVDVNNGNIVAHPGWAVGYFFLGFFLYLFGIVKQFIHQIRTRVGIERTQLQYILGSFALSFTCIILFNVVAPLVLHSSALITFTNVAPLIFIAVVAFTIVRYRLLDIRIIVQRTTVYLLTLLIILGVSALLVDFGAKYYHGNTQIVWTLTVITFGLLIFDLLKTWIEHLANRFFFTSLYNVQVTLADLGRELTHTIDLQQIVDSVVETIKSTMKLDRAGVLLYDRATSNYHVVKNIGFNEENGISLVRNNFLTNHLTVERRSVLLQELEGMQVAGRGNGDVGKLIANMKRIEAALCLPLTFGKHLIGIVVLGSKVTKEAYTTGDLQLLDSIADQASIAIQNGLLYQQVQDFNRNLQSKVNEQTKDIAEQSHHLKVLLDQVQRTNAQLEIANKHLQELDRAKSEFVSIASHQLRTPMTGIMGYLSMLTEGDFGQVKPEHQTILVNLLLESQRMIRLINQFLNVSKIEAGKFTYTRKPAQLTDLVANKVKVIAKAAADKGLALTVTFPPTPLPLIQVDADKIEDVILNLLDNAVKYTAQGTIDVSVTSTDREAIFTVKDSGIGIKPQDATELFNKFVRGTGIAQIHPDGSGLGLFIAKSVIDAHGGRIWAESAGEGKGSTFQFTLPLQSVIAPPATVHP